MQGSVDISVGYSEYYVNPTTALAAFAGGDAESDSSVPTDWVECQVNAKSAHDADTTLGTVYYSYGGIEQGAIEMVQADSYGSRIALTRLGWRLHFQITNTWKANGTIFKLAVGGFRSRWYNSGAPDYIFGGSWDDFGRLYFRYSENAALFTSGGHIVSSFGTADFYLDMADLNNTYRAQGKNPWDYTYQPNNYIYITLDANYLRNMVGEDLYLWMYTPWYPYPYYNPGPNTSITMWKFNPYRIYTYY